MIECLIKLESNDIEVKADGKVEYLERVSGLLPGGKPLFLDVVRYPKISDLAESQGKKVVRKVLFLMLKDFCNSVNVVRNMNEDQLLEGAVMLLDECDNFRLEDYAMMFAMAKRGDLVKIYDRIDLPVLSEIMDRYYEKRFLAGEKEQENGVQQLETMGETTREIETLNPSEAKLLRANQSFVNQFEGWKQVLKNEDGK